MKIASCFPLSHWEYQFLKAPYELPFKYHICSNRRILVLLHGNLCPHILLNNEGVPLRT